MRVLVTGAHGFVGGHLCALLRQAGHSVVEAVRKRDPAAAPGGEVVETGAIERFDGWAPLLRGVDAVVHLAARVHVMSESEADPEQAFRNVNTLATERLAGAAATAGVRRFVYSSSVKVNGEATGSKPFDALDAPAPVDAYGRSKLAAEQAIARVASSGAIEFTVVRPPLVYGPGVGGNVLRLMRWIERGVPLPLACVRNARSLVSVWTLCDLLARCLDAPRAANRTLMVADGTDLSTPELVRHLARGIGRPARLFPAPPALLRVAGALAGRSAEVDRLIGSLQVDTSATRELLDWVAPIDAATALERTGRWFASRTADPANRVSG
jgi:nucleoside-diphosphate-sugar epimerase